MDPEKTVEGNILDEVRLYLQQSWFVLLIALVTLVWLVFKNRRGDFMKYVKQKQKLYGKAGRIEEVPSMRSGFKTLKIFYGTQTGMSKMLATQILETATSKSLPVELVNIQDYDPEDQLSEETDGSSVCLFIVSTYTDGQPPENVAWFYKWLSETADDFRVQKTLLNGMQYAVVGLGNSLYKDHFNVVGRNIDKWLHQLSAHRMLPLGLLDENVAGSKHGGTEADFEAWKDRFWEKIPNFLNSVKASEQENSTQNTESEAQMESSSDEDTDDEDNDDKSGLVDMEDLGKVMKKSKVDRKSSGDTVNSEPREMITPILRKSLEKQGYRLIGSHSGVKLCRWTKSMLRGRGGCYKHTFYGIESHRCMETTPSLACANKCVFCWRHHTNPVGTEWKWKMDDPETVIQGAIQNHHNMIKQFRGVPGVKPERFKEAHEIKHCALSLVGEPIMYPEINEFVRKLHSKKISSFLVTNAQFPDAIRNLLPVTQLYVSVDASTKESLKKIDRPLFRDFWPRFLDSLRALADKGQRTVYRLTLVKAFNTEELEQYAELVSLGKPDFIEVKGVTYCGESKASKLTMENIPWHDEVLYFVQQLADRLPGYEVAAEHEHSNCVLIANTKFKVGGEWHTWIDYEKFHSLIKDYRDSNGEKSFTAVEYMEKTPHWAVFGAQERGFDPGETRFHRKRKTDISGC